MIVSKRVLALFILQQHSCIFIDAIQLCCYIRHVDIVGESESVFQSKKTEPAIESMDTTNPDHEALFFLALYQILSEAESLKGGYQADV